MTNAEKYLKDNVSVEELAKDITKFIADGYPDSFIFPKSIENYFKAEVKPTLTEDERVILRNIDKKYKKISRENDTIYLVNGTRPYVFDCNFDYFSNLFQFIKERRRIFNRGAIRR